MKPIKHLPRLLLVPLLGIGLAVNVQAADLNAADMEKFVASMEEAANQLNTELEGLTGDLSNAAKSKELAEERFAKLDAMLDSISASVADVSENWKLIDQMLEQAIDAQKEVMKEYDLTKDPDYKMFAKKWQEKETSIIKLRDEIRKERNEMENLRGEVELSRKKVIQAIRLNAFDIALKKLEAVRDKLKTMNKTMSDIVTNSKNVTKGLNTT